MPTIPKTYKLSSGYLLPSLGLGTYDIPRAETAEVVYQGLKAGYRHLDTAVLYGNESEVAQGIHRWLQEDPKTNKRSDVFYTTKLWNSQNGYANAQRAIKECMEKARPLGYIDMLLIHSPLSGSKRRLETYKAMQEAVDQGIVKSVGVSNYGKHHVDELLAWPELKHKPVVNQIEISPWIMRQDLADHCKSKGLVVEAFSPLTHGYKLKHPNVLQVAKETGYDAGQVLIRWSLQHGYVPLPKSRSVARLTGNLKAYDFELTPAQMSFLDQPEAYEPTDWECTDAP
ncbi:LANO_0H11100g1_1 [Lachancea nothofagi CBS 11611]|uniref:LANO_0H11100g1_1 n=1 Tax=Lachancea nothofagi CBS 11611 TaxID=1266666 RepID=A0A1G4KM20_9SACH|nr:LANO_0H11100g1_1 [Lachancea nothofagi CBS 11611]